LGGGGQVILRAYRNKYIYN